MASLIYDSYFDDSAKGNIVIGTDTIKVMLLTSSYAASKTGHTRRSDITNEVSGAGYSAGGAAATCSATKDTVNNREDVTLGSNTWASATITARGAVYYKSRGGAASADELLAYIDFGSDIVSTAGNFALASSILRIQN